MPLRRSRSPLANALGLLSCSALALGLGGCGKSKPTARPAASSSPSPVKSTGKPLTDEECLALAREIEDAARSGDGAQIDRLIDWDSIEQRATAGVDAPEQLREGVIDGLRRSRNAGKSLSLVIADTVKNGGRAIAP